jgi:hypothetical protein
VCVGSCWSFCCQQRARIAKAARARPRRCVPTMRPTCCRVVHDPDIGVDCVQIATFVQDTMNSWQTGRWWRALTHVRSAPAGAKGRDFVQTTCYTTAGCAVRGLWRFDSLSQGIHAAPWTPHLGPGFACPQGWCGLDIPRLGPTVAGQGCTVRTSRVRHGSETRRKTNPLLQETTTKMKQHRSTRKLPLKSDLMNALQHPTSISSFFMASGLHMMVTMCSHCFVDTCGICLPIGPLSVPFWPSPLATWALELRSR